MRRYIVRLAVIKILLNVERQKDHFVIERGWQEIVRVEIANGVENLEHLAMKSEFVIHGRWC